MGWGRLFGERVKISPLLTVIVAKLIDRFCSDRLRGHIHVERVFIVVGGVPPLREATQGGVLVRELPSGEFERSERRRDQLAGLCTERNVAVGSDQYFLVSSPSPTRGKNTLRLLLIHLEK